MAEPITVTLPLWGWLVVGLGWFLGGVLGSITSDWLTGKTKPKQASVDD
jgi:hypothetical protein